MMSPSATAYHVQTTAEVLRDGFPYFSHHQSVSALWSQKWRISCAAGIYPFVDGNVQDFDPVFAELENISGNDPAILFQPDDYAAPFFPPAQRLTESAENSASLGDTAQAREQFLRAAALYRIARFPINRSTLSQKAWEAGKAVYERGGLLMDPPSTPVDIAFSHADPSSGDRTDSIQAYLRVPTGVRPDDGWPIVLFICGLDAYRTDNTQRRQQHNDHGFATLIFEIPGTGDCPAAPNDPTAPDRIMSSVLDWVSDHSRRYGIDVTKTVVRGISTGGYYAFRAAHTHADRLFAVAAQGGGCHHMFDPAWIHAQDQMEYPFALAEALAYKFGYRENDEAEALERYATEARKFSLVDSGLLGAASCKLLVLNGMEDSIFPIEDSLIVATQGTGKDLIVRGNLRHMANPGGEETVLEWFDATVKRRG
ncbi:alpha/beta hydrolase family protein [Streptomyces bauhiniae]|uniref:alpha/beta hydrolase family protein n=1 Tax=Streptomyces bauhiniae TaxID=2340725 RepID=UPI003656AD88